MVSPEQTQVDQAVRARPPGPDATLEGWVLLSQWHVPEGEPVLTVMGSPAAHVVQLKGYLHEGLYDIARDAYRVASGHLEDFRSPTSTT